MESLLQLGRHRSEVHWRAGNEPIAGVEVLLRHVGHGLHNAIDAVDLPDIGGDGFGQLPGVSRAGVVHYQDLHRFTS